MLIFVGGFFPFNVSQSRVTTPGSICFGDEFDGKTGKVCPINRLNTDNHKPRKRINMVKRSLSNRQSDRIASKGRTVSERSFGGAADGLREASDNEICVSTEDGVKCMPRYGANH